MKATKEFCSFCRKEYLAEVWTKIGGIELTKSHNCEEQQKVEEARKQLTHLYAKGKHQASSKGLSET